MKAWTIRLLVKALYWVSKEVWVPEPPPVPPNPLVEIAKGIVQQVEQRPLRFAKTRHAGLVKNLIATKLLLTVCTDISLQEAKWAIETALRELAE